MSGLGGVAEPLREGAGTLAIEPLIPYAEMDGVALIGPDRHRTLSIPASNVWRYEVPGRLLALTATLLLVAPGTPGAEPLCVTCTGPDRVYACSVEGAAAPQVALQILCIQELARQGGHQSCGVRKATAPCEGEPRTLAYAKPDLGVEPPSAFPVEEAEQPEAPLARKAEAAGTATEPAEPETLIELAGDAAKGTGDQLKKAGQTVSDLTAKAGEAVGGAASKTGSTIKSAAKSTWDCLSSLFSECGASTDAPGTESGEAGQ